MKIDPITEYILQKNGESIQEESGILLAIDAGKISIKHSDQAAAVFTVAGVVLATAIGIKLHQFYKDYINKYTKQCRDIRQDSPSGRRIYAREKCELSVKIKGCSMEIKALNNAKQLCKKSKHPEKCNFKLNEKIRKLNHKIDKMKTKLKSIEREKTYTG